MSKSTSTTTTSTTTTNNIEEEMTQETVTAAMENEVNGVDNLNAADLHLEKIPVSASLEEKINFAINFGKENKTSFFGLIPDETISNLDEENLNKILAKEFLLDAADLDSILIKSVNFKEVQRILQSSVANGYRVETCKEVTVTAYVPIDWTEESVLEKIS